MVSTEHRPSVFLEKKTFQSPAFDVIILRQHPAHLRLLSAGSLLSLLSREQQDLDVQQIDCHENQSWASRLIFSCDGKLHHHLCVRSSIWWMTQKYTPSFSDCSLVVHFLVSTFERTSNVTDPDHWVTTLFSGAVATPVPRFFRFDSITPAEITEPSLLFQIRPGLKKPSVSLTA